MKKVAVTRVVATLLALSLVMPVLGACARSAPSPAPVLKPAPAPVPAPAPKADPLAQVIEGAKKEGTVQMFVSPRYAPPEVIAALEKEIRDKYGVNLKIMASVPPGMGQMMTTAIMEHQTGATPSYDIMNFTISYIPDGVKAGVFEPVDWRPLVPAGSPPEVIAQHPALRGAIVYMGRGNGLVYNPKKVSAAEAPRKIADLLDPKWKGRLGLFGQTSYWAVWAFILGKDKVFSYMRSLINMKPMVAEFTPLNNLYLLGEIDLAFTNTGFVQTNRDKGMPTEVRNLDFIDADYTYLLVRKGAKNPNAAKLVAIYLSSREGAQFSWEKAGSVSLLYPGNYMYDLVEQGKKDGLPLHTIGSYPGLLDFVMSNEYDQWQKQIGLILRGAG